MKTTPLRILLDNPLGLHDVYDNLLGNDNLLEIHV